MFIGFILKWAYLGVSVHQTIGVVVGLVVVRFVVVGLEVEVVAHHGVLVVGFCVVLVHHGTVGGFSVVEEVAHHGVVVVGFFDGVVIHDTVVVVGFFVGLVGVLGVHHGDVVVFLVVVVVHAVSLVLAPVSTPVVLCGGAGVEGVGGLVQSPSVGWSAIKPNSLFIERRSGNAPSQHWLVKSSKSIVHATAPPNPLLLIYFAYK